MATLISVEWLFTGGCQVVLKSNILSILLKALSAQQEDNLCLWCWLDNRAVYVLLMSWFRSVSTMLNEYMRGYCRLNEVGQFYDRRKAPAFVG